MTNQERLALADKVQRSIQQKLTEFRIIRRLQKTRKRFSPR